jgi:hypothetical protein
MATDGLSKALQDRLESLSGYEHAFAVTDKRAALNPVNYSHLIVTVANQRLHLLSRVADAGADYSGRSNKLAHHVILQPAELTAASPASTLATPGFCKTQFDGTPRSIPQGATPPTTPRPLTVCSAWESVCKDAGWAGYLAELTLQNPSRATTLIYAPGCDVLPLVVEALSLLPADRQWRTTFSTFFTKLPAGVECQWRFVLDGTPAADQARRNLQSPPIDLTSAGKVPSAGPLVEAARTGRMPVGTPDISVPATSEASTAGLKTIVPGRNSRRGSATETSSDSYRLSTTQSRPPRMGASAGDELFKQGLSPTVLGAAIGGSALVLVLVIGLGAYLMSGPTPPPPAPPTENPERSVADIEKPTVLVKAEAPKTVVPQNRVIESTTVAQNDPKVNQPVAPAQPQEKPLSFDEITKDIRSKGTVLSLSPREGGTAPVGEHELCKIFVKQPGDCNLELVTTETLDDGQPRLYLKRDEMTEEGIQSWTAISRVKNSALPEIQETPIGLFILKDQTLYFEWTRADDWTSPFGLLYCKLDVHVGSEKIQCSLTKPTIKVADRLDLAHRKASMPVEISAGTLSSVKFLRYDIELSLGDWSESKPGIKAEDTKPLKFEIPSTDKSHDSRIDLEVRFVPPTDKLDAAFAYRAYIHPTYLAEIQGPRWERITKRNDEIEQMETTKEGFIVPDFKAYRKTVVDLRKRASKAWEATKADHVPIAAALARAQQLKLSEKELQPYQKRLEDSASLIAHRLEAVKFGDESLEWIGATEKHFEEIQSDLEVRFTMYLEFLNGSKVEKVILVQTNPPPSKGGSKAEDPPKSATNADIGF